jgi:isocitrate/isopropylmalate dehydrogenase
MMLRESLGHVDAALAVEEAVAATVRAGARTADLAGGADAAALKLAGLTLVGTREATDLIVEQVLNAKGGVA